MAKEQRIKLISLLCDESLEIRVLNSLNKNVMRVGFDLKYYYLMSNTRVKMKRLIWKIEN